VSHLVAYEQDELLVDSPALIATNYRRQLLALDLLSGAPWDAAVLAGEAAAEGLLAGAAAAAAAAAVAGWFACSCSSSSSCGMICLQQLCRADPACCCAGG
jgi:hypothetical protein